MSIEGSMLQAYWLGLLVVCSCFFFLDPVFDLGFRREGLGVTASGKALFSSARHICSMTGKRDRATLAEQPSCEKEVRRSKALLTAGFRGGV